MQRCQSSVGGVLCCEAFLRFLYNHISEKQKVKRNLRKNYTSLHSDLIRKDEMASLVLVTLIVVKMHLALHFYAFCFCT